VSKDAGQSSVSLCPQWTGSAVREEQVVFSFFFVKLTDIIEYSPGHYCDSGPYSPPYPSSVSDTIQVVTPHTTVYGVLVNDECPQSPAPSVLVDPKNNG
jgi:hypothetical protein